jgi:hypothetical protein
MTAVFLIRHGATAVNRQTPYRLQGRRIDVSLDTIGIEQARRSPGPISRCRGLHEPPAPRSPDGQGHRPTSRPGCSPCPRPDWSRYRPLGRAHLGRGRGPRSRALPALSGTPRNDPLPRRRVIPRCSKTRRADSGRARRGAFWPEHRRHRSQHHQPCLSRRSSRAINRPRTADPPSRTPEST